MVNGSVMNYLLAGLYHPLDAINNPKYNLFCS